MHNVGSKGTEFREDRVARQQREPLADAQWIAKGAQADEPEAFTRLDVGPPPVAGGQHQNGVAAFGHPVRQSLRGYCRAADHRRIRLADVGDPHLGLPEIIMEISRHKAPICGKWRRLATSAAIGYIRSEEHTSELQS